MSIKHLKPDKKLFNLSSQKEKTPISF